jgi:hypothetical protein
MSWIEAENAFRLICHAWKTEKQLYRISIRYIARNTIAQQMILYPVHPCFRFVSETTQYLSFKWVLLNPAGEWYYGPVGKGNRKKPELSDRPSRRKMT